MKPQLMSHKDFIETAKRLISIAEAEDAKETEKAEKAAALAAEQPELELKGMTWPVDSTRKCSAKRTVMIVLKGEFGYKEFCNRKDLLGHYKLPKQCYTSWPHFPHNVSGGVAEDEIIKAEAVWLSHFMAQSGNPIKMYGRYRSRQTGGNAFFVNLEDLEKADGGEEVTA